MAEAQGVRCSTLGEVAQSGTGHNIGRQRTRHTAESGRVCRTCPAHLSMYNLDDQCRPCARGEAEAEATLDAEWRRVFGETTDGDW